MPAVPARILPTIVLSQFAATSLWFAGNAVMPDPQRSAGLPASALGDITIAVQLGFIAGTAGPQYVFLVLVPGPVFGLAALRRLVAKPA